VHPGASGAAARDLTARIRCSRDSSPRRSNLQEATRLFTRAGLVSMAESLADEVSAVTVVSAEIVYGGISLG
jgi:hypothetical protein